MYRVYTLLVKSLRTSTFQGAILLVSIEISASPSLLNNLKGKVHSKMKLYSLSTHHYAEAGLAGVFVARLYFTYIVCKAL